MVFMHTTFPMLLLLLMMVVGLCRGLEETDTSRCSPNGVQCKNDGVCEQKSAGNSTILELCKCQRHFSGKECKFPNSACTKTNCKHGSFCSVNECKCTNSTLYTGEDCSEVHCIVNGLITEDFCKNGGICYEGKCLCPNNTRGEQCELIACGQYSCRAGYCALDKCDCDIACSLGCDVTTGECKTVPDTSEDDAGLSLGTKVMIGVVAGITLLVVLPALYAMYNMRIENRQRNARLRSHMELERMTQQAYIEKEENRKAEAAARAKEKEERRLARQKRHESSDPLPSTAGSPSTAAALSTAAHSTKDTQDKGPIYKTSTTAYPDISPSPNPSSTDKDKIPSPSTVASASGSPEKKDKHKNKHKPDTGKKPKPVKDAGSKTGKKKKVPKKDGKATKK